MVTSFVVCKLCKGGETDLAFYPINGESKPAHDSCYENFQKEQEAKLKLKPKQNKKKKKGSKK